MKFSNNWFEQNALPTWNVIFDQLQPKRCLEIGSYEGRAAAYLSTYPSVDTLICIDTWEGGLEHVSEDMGLIEQRFDENMSEVTKDLKHFLKLKGTSAMALANLYVADHKNFFDFI